MGVVQIHMIRSNLDDIPQHELPSPYSIRPYRPGDEEAWLQIHLEADKYSKITRALFRGEFGADAAQLQERQLYLCDAAGNEIGTTTAWFDDDYHGLPYGRIHWVAIVPSMQGRGLAKPMLAAACNRLLELGHERACLGTHTVRVPAIVLYLTFGFVPDVRSDEELRAWHDVRDAIAGGPRPEAARYLHDL